MYVCIHAIFSFVCGKHGQAAKLRTKARLQSFVEAAEVAGSPGFSRLGTPRRKLNAEA